ncbi:VanZ family protein [Loigolactobacillus coryniformis]|uniref:VanZ family protein n=1 Tax=Loigolactobacillus coryniformis TaxID=1610 RepID=A0A5B8TD58_9LACO|nr:VanZ family protein [Loigolactobacillus coryniformis]QEA52673.1 VanZ family protein [Loigolactobacillus coryniformis]
MVQLQALQNIDPTFYLNIVMAVPLGVYYGLLIPRANIVKVFCVGVLASGFVEVAQYVLDHSILLNRNVDINDVISNVLGVLLGYVALKVVGLVGPKLIRRFKYFDHA